MGFSPSDVDGTALCIQMTPINAFTSVERSKAPFMAAVVDTLPFQHGVAFESTADGKKSMHVEKEPLIT